MITCINKNSNEWREVLAEANGDEDKAKELWLDKGYDENSDITDFPVVEEPDEITNNLSKLTAAVKVNVAKQLRELKEKNIPDQARKEKVLERLNALLDATEGVESINQFVEDAYNKARQAETRFDDLVKNKENLSRHDMIHSLVAINDFANEYSILDEISQHDIEEYFSRNLKGIPVDSYTTQDKLTAALNTRYKIKQRFLSEGIPLLADYLLEQNSSLLSEKTLGMIKEIKLAMYRVHESTHTDKEKIRRLNNYQKQIDELQGYNLDKQKLVDQLRLASKDESVMNYLFDPLISSSDSVLSLFAKSIKSELETARLEDIKFAKEASVEKSKYQESQGNIDNFAKYNEGIYEEIELPVKDSQGKRVKDEAGNIIYNKYMAFVQKYDVTIFEKNKENFWRRVGPKPVLTEFPTRQEISNLKRWKREVASWYSQNTQPKEQSEIDRTMKEKLDEKNLGIITPEEYREWLDRVIFENENTGQISYRYELAEPGYQYINPKWTALQGSNNSKGRYYKFLLDSYLKAQEVLPEGNRMGYILPSISKGPLERAQSNGAGDVVKTKLRESAFRQAYDTEYGSVDNDEGTKFLPVFYTQRMSPKDVSLDLLSSVMQFKAMSNRYQALNNINGEISLAKTVVGNRKVISTNSRGEQVVDTFAKKMGYEEFIKKNGESYSQKHLDAFIDMIVNGEMHKAEQILGFDASKITSTFTGFSAITTIALDLLKGVANNIQGNIQTLIEATSGEFFSIKNLNNGKLYYYKSIPKILSDFGKLTPETLPNELIELYDAIQGKFKDNYGRNISGSIARKLFATDTLFFNQNIGEHEIQVSSLFAILDATKVKVKETGEEISLLQAYNSYGIEGTNEKTDFTEKKRQDVMNRLHALNKRLQGVYNEFDRGVVQRYSLGRLAIMYRKHLVPGYKRRFKKMSPDQELGGVTEGYYRTFWNAYSRDLRAFKLNVVKNWSTYTPFEKMQIKRTITEMTIILSLVLVAALLKGLGDDDETWKKNYAYNFALYEAIRMRSETSQYISPMDAYRVVRSPSAMIGTLERAIKFGDQFFLTWDPQKLNYQRKSGIWAKGDNKSWAYFLKLMGFSGYNISPDAAIQSFNSTFVH